MGPRYIFIEFNTPKEAEHAKTAMDKHPFDARHRFQINLLSDIETFKDMDETYVEPPPEEFELRVGFSSLLLGAPWVIMCVAIRY
jgi:translation initiation factor 3 subunit B